MKSLKTIFNEVYGEGLAEYGFKKVSGKYPYFARVVGDEIVQVITYKTYSSNHPDYREFTLLAGVITVYRENLRFDISPDGNTGIYCDLRGLSEKIDYSNNYLDYCIKNEDDMKKIILKSYDNCLKYIIPSFDEVKNLVDCLEYYIRYDIYGQMYIHDYFADDIIEKLTDCSEGMLLYKCFDKQNSKKLIEKYYNKAIDFNKRLINKVKNEEQRNCYLRDLDNLKNSFVITQHVIEKTYEDKDKMLCIKRILEERRQRNTEELRKYKLL